MPECGECGAAVLKVIVSGRCLTVDAAPTAAGTVIAHKNGAGGYTARLAMPGERAIIPEQRHIEHQFTCPAAVAPPSVTEPRVEHPGIDQLAEWRKAQSAHNAAKRRRSWRRRPRQEPTAGYRKPPQRGT